MNAHRKVRSLATVSYEGKAALAAEVCINGYVKARRVRQRSFYNKEKEYEGLKMLKNKLLVREEGKKGVLQERKESSMLMTGKMLDFRIQSGITPLKGTSSPNQRSNEFKHTGSPQLHNLKRYKLSYRKRIKSPSIDSALMISKKLILPSSLSKVS